MSAIACTTLANELTGWFNKKRNFPTNSSFEGRPASSLTQSDCFHSPENQPPTYHNSYTFFSFFHHFSVVPITFNGAYSSSSLKL